MSEGKDVTGLSEIHRATSFVNTLIGLMCHHLVPESIGLEYWNDGSVTASLEYVKAGPTPETHHTGQWRYTVNFEPDGPDFLAIVAYPKNFAFSKSWELSEDGHYFLAAQTIKAFGDFHSIQSNFEVNDETESD